MSRFPSCLCIILVFFLCLLHGSLAWKQDFMSVGAGATACFGLSDVPGNKYDASKPKSFLPPYEVVPSSLDKRPRYMESNLGIPGLANLTVLRANRDGHKHWQYHVKLEAGPPWQGWAILQVTYPPAPEAVKSPYEYLFVIFPGHSGCILAPDTTVPDYKISFSYQIITDTNRPQNKAHGSSNHPPTKSHLVHSNAWRKKHRMF